MSLASGLNSIVDSVLELGRESEKQARDMAELKTRTARLSSDIEELKQWAASLPKSSDSDFSHTHKRL